MGSRQRSIFTHILGGMMLVLTVTAVAMYAIGGHWMRTAYVGLMRENLAARCAVTARPLTAMLREGRRDEFAAMAAAAAATGARVTVISSDGTVILDSEKDPSRMENHGTRPEVVEARRHGSGSRIRFSTTLGRDLLYVARAFPAPDGGRPWVLRLAMPMHEIEEQTARLRRYLVLTVILVAALGGIMVAALAKRIATPLERIARSAERFGRGDLSGRVPAGRTRETMQLSRAFNLMAENLSARMNDLRLQHQKLEALFAGMTEGVLIIGRDGIIRQANPAAARFLGRADGEIAGRGVIEVIRNTALLTLSRDTLASSGLVEATVEIDTPGGQRHLQVVGSPLTDPAGEERLAVLVMRDVTSLFRLEGLRREFVANVSHELKTPITAIIGAVETIDADPGMDEESRGRFLAMIRRQAGRLQELVEDILALSRLESAGLEETAMETRRVEELVDEALSLAAERITAQRAVVERAGAMKALLRVDFGMMSRALANLVDNAVKYGPEGGLVRITVRRDRGRVEIAVRDQGDGIAPADLGRIFERFYRADRSRSRRHGGTGLGLAIVKHTVEEHGGRVWAESEPGKGSVFFMSLPEETDGQDT